MPKLNDTQLILLSTAAQRASGSLLPLPEMLAAASDRAAKAIAALTKRGFTEERETNDAASVHRTDGDIGFGVFITEDGTKVLDVGPASNPAPAPTDAKPQRVTKSAAVIALLGREQGATMAELIDATGWLPHTTRAALTGLRKKGHVIERNKCDDQTTYRILAAA